MKKIIPAVAVLMLLLTGCAVTPEGGTKVDGYGGDASLLSNTVTLNDGRTVECVTLVGSYKAGLTCDWEGSR